MTRKTIAALLTLLWIGCTFVLVSAPAGKGPMKHVIVSGAPGRFSAWPANNGVWIWGNEILVGFSYGYYEFKGDSHSVSTEKPLIVALARSKDGGATWAVEEHPELGNNKATPCPGGIDFTHPDFALRCGDRDSFFHVSYDRGKTWKGPYALGDFGKGLKLSNRTDYLVNGKNDAMLFLSAEVEGVQAGNYKDRAFMARTTDGGKTFEFVSWVNGEPRSVRGVMPSTVRVSPTELVTALRRRLDPLNGKGSEVCWVDAWGSKDDGSSWLFLSRIAYTDLGRRNGNPPSLIRLKDGRLCVAYGFRAVPYGMRAKISTDNGASWGPEIVLRDSAGTWDFGYPRSVVRPDGRVVTMYYFNTAQRPEQHIAATIWEP